MHNRYGAQTYLGHDLNHSMSRSRDVDRVTIRFAMTFLIGGAFWIRASIFNRFGEDIRPQKMLTNERSHQTRRIALRLQKRCH